MQIYRTDDASVDRLYALLKDRAKQTSKDITEKVSAVLKDVRENGDAALYKYASLFDRVELKSLEMTQEEIDASVAQVSKELKDALIHAARNIRKYHEKQRAKGYALYSKNKTLARIVRPLERVGVYVPGGTAAYPSTVLMNCIPAQVAGVSEIILVTPPKAEGVNPAVVAAARIAGVNRIFTVGGAQAIAALAYGTETVPAVDKIVGPGNMFVAEAKRQVFGEVAIDMIAGPSEVCVVADGSAPAAYAAADFLSQLEHDRAASATLITTDERYANAVRIELELQLKALPRAEIATQSYNDFSAVVIASSIEDCMDVANRIAPEHLELLTADPEKLLPMVKNAGSIFMGAYSPEPMGDYYAGTNHVLPTSGTARFSSPLSVEDFLKKMSCIQYQKEGFLKEADDVVRMARAEGLDAHANAVLIRKKL
ncbi:MAG: histidinol dehydrogenase [Clostridia bacterium]|nr:histidinol dehydrogenase [Clostridia bacterium]MBQ3927058.1 histidinol dehydrogenase [Clostridia bacterium]